MRPLRAVPCVLVLACLFPAASLADDFSAYRIPEHRLRSLSLALAGDYGHFSGVQTGASTRSSSLRGITTADGYWIHDSDPRQWSLLVIGSGDLLHSENTGDTFDAPSPTASFATHDVQRQTRAAEQWLIGGSVALYPGTGLFGFELSGNLRGNDRQLWSTQTNIDEVNTGSENRSESQAHAVEWMYLESATFSATAGYGRVRDATPVFAALLLEERLTRDHAVVRSLSRAARQRLADLFTLRGDFQVVHDLSDKFFWREVERILREDGTLSESGLDAWSAQHVEEDLVVAGNWLRYTGFFVGPMVRARHAHSLSRVETRTGSRFFTGGVLVSESLVQEFDRTSVFDDRTLYGATAEYHRPLGRRTQLDVAERALVDLEGDPDGLDIAGNATLSRLVGERWFFAGTVGHSRWIENRAPEISGWSLFANAAVAWFVEDFVSLQLSLTEQQDHSVRSLVYFARPEFRDRDFRVTLGMSLRRGVLHAPGIGVSERPIR